MDDEGGGGERPDATRCSAPARSGCVRRPSCAWSGWSIPRWSRRVVPSYSVRKTPRSWSSGTTVSANSSRPPGVRCGTRMNPSLASACTNASMVRATVAGEPTKLCRLPVWMTRSRMDQSCAAASSRHSRATASRSWYSRTWARPRTRCSSPVSGSMSGSGPSGSYEDRSRFQTNSRCRRAVAPLTWRRRTSRARSSASASVSPSTKVAAGRMSNWSWRRPYLARRDLTSV